MTQMQIDIIVVLIFGIIIGYVFFKIGQMCNWVGTIYIEEDELDGPYMFIETDTKKMSKMHDDEYVTVRIHRSDLKKRHDELLKKTKDREPQE